MTKPVLACRPIFDAIICDPPYGVKVCSRSKNTGSQDANKGKFDVGFVYSRLIDIAR